MKINRQQKHTSKLTVNPALQSHRDSLEIHDLTHDGRGVGRLLGKAVFVVGALPGETADVQVVNQKSQYIEAKLLGITNPSPARVDPVCAHFGVCGGCQLQHISDAMQHEFKRHQLERSLQKADIKLADGVWQTDLLGDQFHYRRRTRFAINRQGELCYRALGGKNLAIIQDCPQLSQSLSNLFQKLKHDIPRLPYQGVDEVELLSIGDNTLILHLNLQWRDMNLAPWQAWCAANGVTGLGLQGHGRDGQLTIVSVADLHYALGDIRFGLTPDQFVQAHEQVNQHMVATAVEWLAAGEADTVLELFCGMGNFSLPLAKHAQNLLGLELSDKSVAAAKENALANGLTNCTFAKVDIFADDWICPREFSHVLLDPPWDGALAAATQLAKRKSVKRIVYVSCHPATLARDLVLLQKGGFKVQKICMADQFPQSYHVESVVLLTR
jgi:23S rRNA (uracil1939-C5)-methyltransferase